MTALRTAIEQDAMKHAWLAKQLGLAPQNLSKIVNGWASERIVRRWGPRIAEIMGRPVGDLFPELEWGPGNDERKERTATKAA